MPRRLQKGCLVVIEGIDGAGKSIQCERLAKKLRDEGWDVERLREPTDGPHGRRIRELARQGRGEVDPKEEFDLFLEDRRENVRDHIRPALERGAIVLLDRYYYSSIAYQGARGLDPAFIRRENEKFAPPADLLVYLSIPVDVAGLRIENRRKTARDLFEGEDYLRRVKEHFDAMEHPRMIGIDGTAGIDEILEMIWTAIQPLLRGAGDEEKA